MNKTLQTASSIANQLKEKPEIAREIVNFFDNSSQLFELLGAKNFEYIKKMQNEISYLEGEVSSLEDDIATLEEEVRDLKEKYE